jgi:hypothetical protein
MNVNGKKVEALIVLVAGIGVLAASLLADVIGIANAAGFGNQQTVGTVLGVVIVGGGLILQRRAR